MKLKLFTILLLNLFTFSFALAQTATNTSASTTLLNATSTLATTSSAVENVNETISKEKKANIALTKYSYDPKNNPYPVEFKQIKKEIDNYINDSIKYSDLLFKSNQFVYDLESQNFEDKNGAKRMVKLVDDRIKAINLAKAKKDKSSVALEKAVLKIKNKKLIEEYNLLTYKNEKELLAQLEVIRINIIEYLYNSRGFYLKLSNSKEKFAFLNGLFLTGNYEISLSYFEYLAKSRLVSKMVIGNVNKFYELYNLNTEFLKTYLPPEDYNQLQKNISGLQQAQKDLNNNVAIANDISQKTLNMELVRRIDEDGRIEKLSAEMIEGYNQLNILVASSTGQYIYSDKLVLSKAAELYNKINKADKQIGLLQYQLKLQFFKENTRKLNDRPKFDYLSDAEMENYQKEIRDLLYETAHIDYTTKVVNLLNSNFGKIKSLAEDPNTPYYYSFADFKADQEYRKLFDNHQKEFSVQIKANNN